ncbi:hypothetical protein RZS08_37700, partial [Arthrospira platensis SPKY1]|nr:hypothetical protein [Arthrospira platensis SPKY1]
DMQYVNFLMNQLKARGFNPSFTPSTSVTDSEITVNESTSIQLSREGMVLVTEQSGVLTFGQPTRNVYDILKVF